MQNNPINDLPMGLGMALAQNTAALEYFTALSPDEQRRVISHTHSITSQGEMRSYVQSLGSSSSPLF